MVFIVNKYTDKIVRNNLNQAAGFYDRSVANAWLERQGLNTNEFRVICERCFKKRYERELA